MVIAVHTLTSGTGLNNMDSVRFFEGSKILSIKVLPGDIITMYESHEQGALSTSRSFYKTPSGQLVDTVGEFVETVMLSDGTILHIFAM